MRSSFFIIFPIQALAVLFILTFSFAGVWAQPKPTANDNTVTGIEDNDYIFADADFSGTGGSGTYTGLSIQALPAVGTLYIDADSDGQVDAGEVPTLGTEILFSEPLKFKPEPDGNGAPYTTFDYTIWDTNNKESNNTAIITVNINSVNDAPASVDNTVTGDEDVNYVFNSADFTFTDPDVGDVLTTLRISALPTKGTFFLDLDQNSANDAEDITLNQEISATNIDKLTYVGESEESGTPYAFFSFQVGDAAGAFSGEHSMQINLNNVEDPPTSADNSVSLLEDEVFVFQSSDFSYGDPEGAPLDHIRISTVPANGVLWIDSDGNASQNEAALVDNDLVPAADISKLSFQPAADGNGSPYSSFLFEVNDGTLYSTASYTMELNVTPVNDAPSFTVGANQTINEDAGPQTVNSWATGISAGPADEAGQALTFNVSNDNNALFSAQPSVSATGILTYTPADDANGSATVTVSLSDDGGMANGGQDTSPEETFTITVNPVNDLPTVADKTLNVDENVADGTLMGNAGANDPDGDALAHSITAGNTGTAFSIDAATGDITVNNPPGLDYETLDQYILTVEVTDGGAPQSAQITINVNDVNDIAPTINNGTYTTDENTPNGTVITTLIWDEPEGNPVSFSITAGNTGGAFSVNGLGELLVANSTALDFETNHPFNLTVEISDGVFTDNAAIDVNLNNMQDPPRFTSDPSTYAVVGNLYTYNITVVDDEGNPITITDFTLPAWLTFNDNGNGTGDISGTPGAGDAGDNPVILNADDGTDNTDQSFTITVAGSAINVDAGGGGDYPTIQEGINNASNGDLVLVADGTYNENINFNGKDITIIGNTSDPSQCVINGGGSGSVVTVASGETDVSMQGLTISNGTGINTIPSGSGFYGPTSMYGGGVYCNKVTVEFDNVVITGNSVASVGQNGGSGGGLYAVGANITISNSTIKNNTADIYRGGGICLDASSNLTLNNVEINDNTGGNYGGGLSIWNSTVDMTDVSFSGNTVTGSNGAGGAVYLLNASQNLTNVSLISNSSSKEGAGIYSFDSTKTGNYTGSDKIITVQ